MSGSRRLLGARLLLLFLGLVVSAGLLELALRVAGIGGPLPLEPVFDREVVEYRPEEGAGSVRKWLQRRLKVAVIGDSFTNGDGVTWGYAYPERLQQLLNLNAAAPAAQVRVWARNGSNTVDELRFLEGAIRWKPDLIILGVFLNDSEGGGDEAYRELRRAMLPRVPEGWQRSMLRSSRALAWLYDRWDQQRRNAAAGQYSDLVFSPDYPGWQGFEAALDTFVRRTAKKEIPLVAVLFPHLDGVGPDYDPTGHDRMLAALTDRSIPTLALRPIFLDKSPMRMLVFPGVDGHPNEIAHRIAARALFEYLLDEGFVDEAFRPRNVHTLRTREQWLRQLRRYQNTPFYPP